MQSTAPSFAPSFAPAPGPEPEQDPARPRIAIMGEFSAGKSTLTNLLLGQGALPTRVTATQLPPVWLSYGQGPPLAETVDGTRHAVDLADPGRIDLDGTRCLRVFREAEILRHCDLIDFPGISDPNMDAEVWQRLVPLADAVVWCTHATQAWRQTEAAVWEDMPPELHAVSLLLLTRIDRLPEARDRRRVVARVTRETDGLFAGVYPVSLTRCLAAGQDRAAFEACGGAALSEALFDLIARLSPEGRGAPRQGGAATPPAGLGPRRAQDAADPPGGSEGGGAARVVPRRVRRAGGQDLRPARGESDGIPTTDGRN